MTSFYCLPCIFMFQLPNPETSAFSSDHLYACASVKDSAALCREAVFQSFAHTGRQAAPLVSVWMSKLRKCQSTEEFIEQVLDDAVCRDMVENYLCRDIHQQLQTLCVEDEYGSVLSPKNNTNVKSLAEAAIAELRIRAPFLYKVLLMAGNTQSSSSAEWYLFTVYSVLMQHRSQKMNGFQRLITACCVRFHAGNEVRFTIVNIM